MFKKTAIVAALGLAASAAAQAQETPVATGDTYVDNYNWEFNGDIGRSNIDVGRDDGDVDKVGLGGRYYFGGVNTSKGPLGEAAFLDQASSIGAGWVYTDADDIVEDVDADSYTIDGRLVADLGLPLIFEASWTRDTPEFSDIDYYRVGFGAYITDNTTVVLSYRTSDVDESNNIDPGDIDAYSIELKHLWHLGNGGAIALDGSYGLIDVEDNNINDGDDIDSWNIGGTWYVNNSLGFGADFSRFDNFGIEEDTYGLSAEWFITSSIALSANYDYSEIDDTDVEVNAFALGATMRF